MTEFETLSLRISMNITPEQVFAGSCVHALLVALFSQRTPLHDSWTHFLHLLMMVRPSDIVINKGLYTWAEKQDQIFVV